jgi:hypothetical protein
MPGNCKHAKREPIPGTAGRRMHCSDCDRDFTPGGLPVHHGSIEGFNRHMRRRKAPWGWPACPKCLKAKKDWRQEYDHRPSSIEARKIRAAARVAALVTLRRQYPAAFAAAYGKELDARGVTEVRQHYEVPPWEEILDRLVYAALGVPQAEMEHKTVSRLSGSEQREVVLQIRRLRLLLAKRYQSNVQRPNTSGLLLVYLGVVRRALEPCCARCRYEWGRGNSR